MSTPTVPVKTAAEAAVERFDEAQMPSDEDFLKNFRSKIQPRPSEQIADSLHFSGITLEESRRREKARFLTEQKRLWRERRQAEQQARSAAEQQAELQRNIQAGLYRRKLIELLDTYRPAASQQHELEQILAEAKAKQERISAAETNLPTLVKGLAEVRDLIAGVEARIGQLTRQQAELVEPLRAVYSRAKIEFCFCHGQLAKKQPTKKPAIDKAAGYFGVAYGGKYSWPFESFDRRVEHFSSEQVVSAAQQLEQRFNALDAFNPAVKP